MMMTPADDWFLREWMAELGVIPAEMERRTRWDKRKASHLINGHQPYKRDSLNEAADALDLAPYELLMHPRDALAIRAMFDSAMRRVAEKPLSFGPAPEPSDRLLPPPEKPKGR